eukprot:scaffold3551_cov408-Prasinococcus_capsulatus_cf.AAC.2
MTLVKFARLAAAGPAFVTVFSIRSGLLLLGLWRGGCRGHLLCFGPGCLRRTLGLIARLRQGLSLQSWTGRAAGALARPLVARREGRRATPCATGSPPTTASHRGSLLPRASHGLERGRAGAGFLGKHSPDSPRRESQLAAITRGPARMWRRCNGGGARSGLLP